MTKKCCVKFEGTSRMKIKYKYFEKEYWEAIFSIKHHFVGSNQYVTPCVKVLHNLGVMFVKILENLKNNSI